MSTCAISFLYLNIFIHLADAFKYSLPNEIRDKTSHQRHDNSPRKVWLQKLLIWQCRLHVIWDDEGSECK